MPLPRIAPLAGVTLVAVLSLAAWMSTPAGAQDAPQSAAAASAGGTRVAVVDTAAVFNELQEFKDLSQKLEAESRDLQARNAEFQQQIKELESARNLLRAGTPQHDEAQQNYLRKAIEYRAWAELSQAEQQRRAKGEMTRLFEKLRTGVGEFAAQRGIGVVIARQPLEIDQEKRTLEQVKSAILAADVLYVAPESDITNDVIAYMDAAYKAGN